MPRSAVAGPSCKASGAPPPLRALAFLPSLPPPPPLTHTHSAALVCRPKSSDGDALQPPTPHSTPRASFERLLLLLLRLLLFLLLLLFRSSVRPETFSISPSPADAQSQTHTQSTSPLLSSLFLFLLASAVRVRPHHRRRRGSRIDGRSHGGGSCHRTIAAAVADDDITVSGRTDGGAVRGGAEQCGDWREKPARSGVGSPRRRKFGSWT